jgi:pilus assembly protein CpaE
MLTTVVVSSDVGGGKLLRATLEQSGYVSAIRDWTPAVLDNQISAEAVPDVVLLDLGENKEPFFDLAARLRQIRPSVRIIACASMDEPSPEILLRAMRSGVQEFFPKPVDPAALADALARFVQEQKAAGNGQSAGRLIVIAGAKGGVGTSTVTVNLAVQMSAVTNRRVALLDFARPLGQSALLLDLKPRFILRDALDNIERLDAHFLGGLLTPHNSGVQVLAGMQRPQDAGHMVLDALVRVVNVAHGCADYLLIDAGVANLSEWSSLLRMAQSTLLVAETNVPSLWSLERHLSAATEMGLEKDRVRIVINRWHRGDENALQKFEKTLKRPIYARLPNDFRQASNSANLGTPLTSDTSNPLGGKLRQLAGNLTGIAVATAERRGALSSLFSR